MWRSPRISALRQGAVGRVGLWFSVLVRCACGLLLVALLAWSVPRAPRGFALFSWGFFEHQVFLPALTALGASGVLFTLLRRPARYALRDGFWGVLTPIALTVALVGNTKYAAGFAG